MTGEKDAVVCCDFHKHCAMNCLEKSKPTIRDWAACFDEYFVGVFSKLGAKICVYKKKNKCDE